MGSILGLDFGEKRIGVAVAPEGMKVALPLTVFQRKSKDNFLSEIKKLIDSQKAEKLVIGLPKTLKGEIGIAAKKIEEEVDWLGGQIEIPCVLWDERFSSKEVERVLISADVKRQKRKEIVDQLAAQRILQNYVDAN